MPFTFSHPAIVLPLTCLPRRFYSLTGLVIGSLMPDFEYFLRMRIQSEYSHTILGLLWFDLPLGVVFAFVFHNIIRDTIIDNFPTILKSRLSTFQYFDWNKYFRNNWLIVIISIFVGAVSHLLWDSFTHNHGFFIEMIPALSDSIVISSVQIPVFKALQHLSTLVGGIAIAIALYKLPSDKKKTSRVDLNYWMILIGLTLIIITAKLLSGLDYRQYGQLIVTCISSGLISLIVIPLITKIKNRWK